jgi:peptide/nickel transport system ATP-binding protein
MKRETDPMVKIEKLNIIFGTGVSKNHAVKDVSFTVKAGEHFGLVGESGSGKSTVLNCIAGLLKLWTGKIFIDNAPQTSKRLRGFYRNVQMVFQDPYGSLHPRHTVDKTLKEPLKIHGLSDANQRVEKVLKEVGLDNRFRFRYPHQLSGGQRQRVAVARALILGPAVVLLDEPTSALDVSIQAEVLNLLKKIGKEKNLTYILVSHDLAVVSHMCDTIAVMNHGRIIEVITKQELESETLSHDYTKQLLLASKGFDRKAIDQFMDFG